MRDSEEVLCDMGHFCLKKTRHSLCTSLVVSSQRQPFEILSLKGFDPCEVVIEHFINA